MEDFSSEEVSDQNTPHRRASPKTKNLLRQREDIERRYMELQKKLQREFDAKQQEWERLRPAALLLTNSPSKFEGGYEHKIYYMSKFSF